MTRRQKLVVVAALTFTVLLIATARMARGHDNRVRIGYAPIMASVPVFVAQDQKLFESHNLVPQNVSFSSSNDMVSALVSGQVDVLPAVSLVPLIHLEIQHPGKVRVFAHSRMRRGNSTYRIVVAGDSPIRTLQELEGKKLGVFPGTSATRLVSAFLKQKGADPRTITFVQLPPAAQVSSLRSGAVDALFAYDPLELISAPGEYRAISDSVYAELSEPCPLGVSAISRDFERRHPGAAAISTRAIQEAITYTGGHPQQVAALLPRFTRMTLEMASRINVADLTLSNEVDAAALQRFIDMLYQAGEIPEKIDAHRLIDDTR